MATDGEWGLTLSEKRSPVLIGGTYSLRRLRKSHDIVQLLTRQEASEPRAEAIDRLEHNRNTSLWIPEHVLGPREYLSHQLTLAAQLDVDDTLCHLGRLAGHDEILDALDADVGNVFRRELDETVLGLAGAALHDDVDGERGGARVGEVGEGVWEEGLGEELLDLVVGDGVGDLRSSC